MPDDYDDYRTNVFSFGSDENRQEFPYNDVDLDSVRHMDWAISHLAHEEYEVINNQLTTIKQLVAKYNKHTGRIRKLLVKYLMSLMENQFSDFVTTDTGGKSDRSYDLENLLKYFFREVKYAIVYDSKILFSDLKVSKLYDESYGVAGEGVGTIMRSRKEIELEKLDR